ncbi:MAG: glycosyltransferase [Nanoarchaeota archaeon]
MISNFLIYLSSYIGIIIFIFYTLNIFGRKNIKKKTDLVFREKESPFVSIIIPAYNEQKGIARTIESALGIDYPEDKLEIIVVDDGSKDKTLEIAKKYSSEKVKVFSKKNGGKGSALNYGISKSQGEIVVTMDADSIVKPNALKNQVVYFRNPDVMCVSPIVAIYNPKNILERIQQIEYLLGVYLREAFASVNAVHITPGAFSAYRKSFFEEHGGFDTDNLTEDMEMALRIHAHHLIVENSLESIVYTKPPRKFKQLLIQRKRWYIGLIRNFLKYKRLFTKEHKSLGLVVLPSAIFAIMVTVILTLIIAIRSIIDTKKQFNFLQSVNFNIFSTIEFSKYAIESFIINFFTDPIMLFFILFILMTWGYMIFAKRKVKEHSNIRLSLPLFLALYSFLFAFWWVISFIYHFLTKKVSWR